MCSGPVSGESTSAAPSRIADELAQPAAERRFAACGAPGRMIDALRVQLARASGRRRAPAADRSRPERVARPRPSAPGSQSFSGLLVATTIATAGRSNRREELALPRSLPAARARGPTRPARAGRRARRGTRSTDPARAGLRVRRDRCVVNSQFRSRARARSKPSFTGARVNDVTMPALKYTCRSRTRSNRRVASAARMSRNARHPSRPVEEHDLVDRAGARGRATPVRAAAPT